MGAEVMKPLATPVLGGMISSARALLIVTPVIFLWITNAGSAFRTPGPRRARQPVPRRRALVVGAAAALNGVVVLGGIYLWARSGARGRAGGRCCHSTVRRQAWTSCCCRRPGR